jgi:hypothetical protein
MRDTNRRTEMFITIWIIIMLIAIVGAGLAFLRLFEKYEEALDELETAYDEIDQLKKTIVENA